MCFCWSSGAKGQVGALGETYLDVELLRSCAESLENVECRVAPIHILRVEVALHKLTGLFFNPGLDFVSVKPNNK